MGSQPSGSSAGIEHIARPSILAWMVDHVCPDRVQFNVSITGDHVALGIHEARSMSSLPERAGSVIFLVDDSRVGATDSASNLGDRIIGQGCGQEVNVIGHQAIGVHIKTVKVCVLSPHRQVQRKIRRIEEGHSAINAALYQMVAVTFDVVSWSPGH